MTIRHLCILALSLGTLQIVLADRWSRQLTSPSSLEQPLEEQPVVTPTSAFGWIPVTSPFTTSDRSENARVLHYNFNPQVQQPLAPDSIEHRYLAQTAAPQQASQQQQQQGFTFPYTYERFGFPQAQPQIQPKGHIQQIQSPQPTSQSFFKFEMPLNNGGTPQEPAVQTGYQIQHTFGSIPQSQFNSPLFTNKQIFPDFTSIQQTRKPIQQNILDAPKQHLNKPKPVEQSLSYKPYQPQQQQQQIPQQPQNNQEVQLLYVPYDALFNQQNENAVFPSNNQNNKFNYAPQVVNPYQINSFYTPETLSNPNGVYTTSTTQKPTTTITTHAPRPTISTFLNPHPQTFYSTTTEKVVKPKPKPHQPPLAMFVQKTGSRINYRDVVDILSNSNNIDVLDSPTESSPRVFIGPAGMPTPTGYKKFDLPYLSNLNHNNIENNFRDIPYFVAPLSYRNPHGFNKILLPEPHVGSIVVNRQFQPFQQQQHHVQVQQHQPQQQQQQPQEVFQSTTPRHQPTTTHRLKATSARDFYPELMKEITGPRFEISTQRYQVPQTTTKIFKWPGLDDQNSIPINQQTYKAPKIKQKTKRPETVAVQTQKPFNSFKPIPNSIVEDIYKVQPLRTQLPDPTTTTTTTTSTTTTIQPPRFFTSTNPTTAQVEIQSMKGQVYHGVEALNPFIQRPTTPASGVTKEEEYRMKHYFRQQEAFRNRPQVPVTQSPVYHNIQYTPVSVDYDHEVRIPSSTPTYQTTPKERYTFYHPNPTTSIYDQELNTVTPQEDVVEFSRDPEKYTEKPKSTTLLRVPQNHRPTYSNNEIHETEKSHELEYEPNPYKLPSELPPLTPNLPGLVNSLTEKDRLNSLDKFNLEMTAQPEIDTTTPTPTRPTRRPIQRGRKPSVNVVSSSTSVESSSRRTIPRRRPLTPRNTTNIVTTANSFPISSPTRIPTIRNPNRVRYNPSNEERQAFNIKRRKQASNKNKQHNSEQSEDLDYQRDVLKQNYPIIKPSTKYPSPITSPNPINTVQVMSHENTNDLPSEAINDVYTVTPVASPSFPTLLEPMEIAQQYKEYSKENFGPGYFPQEEQSEATEPEIKNEVQPVVITTPSTTSTTTTTTEEPVAITSRRPVFIRRPYRPRPTITTTETPVTTTTPSSNEDRYTIRPRNQPRKVIKIKPRPRRPLHPASTSTTEVNGRETSDRRVFYSKSKYNPDYYQEEQATETPKRLRLKSRYNTNNNNLYAQESQWSPSQSVSSNNFQPVPEKEMKDKSSMDVDNNQEIVTADPNNSQSEDTVLYKVSAGFGPSGPISPIHRNQQRLEDQKKTSISMEMNNQEDKPKSEDQSAFESHKTESRFGTQNRQSGFRRKFRVRPQTVPSETIETSESQNIGQQLINSLRKEEKIEHRIQEAPTTIMPQFSEEISDATSMASIEDSVEEKTPSAPTTTSSTTTTTTTTSTTTTARTTTTPLTTTTTPKSISKVYAFNHKPYFQEVFPTPQPTVITSSEQIVFNTPDTITKRIDNENTDVLDSLEKDQSIFADVKRQLTDLFAAETVDYEEPSKPKEYKSIQRARSVTDSPTTTDSSEDQVLSTIAQEKGFHKKLMDSVVYATSTSKQIETSQDTEICYRGKCIKAIKS